MAKLSVAEKIIKEHLVDGKAEPGEEIGIKIDQTLTQDATGTIAYLQFESLGVERVKTELSVSYIDHNVLQIGYENAEDHEYLRTVADRHGIIFSKPGNGICHQVHLERFAKPGKTLLGSDSHTPTAGGIGMLAIGAGGLDVALAMAGEAFYFKMPEIVGVKLKNKLKPWVSAKDVVLELLRQLTVKGGVGKIFEYFGEGIKSMTTPERATIANMGTELGATTSIFPSDEQTLAFLRAHGREKDFIQIKADSEDCYAEIVEIDLSEIEPMIALPGSPDNVVRVKEVEGEEVSQVIIGSCTNSSYKDLAIVAEVLKKHKISKNLDFFINPGSRQVMENLEKHGLLSPLIESGARICEAACLGCIGLSQSPARNEVSLRTFNRNFKGRSGTKEDMVYLCSPETAIASAIFGKITDPRKLGKYPEIRLPEKFYINDKLIIKPSFRGKIKRGDNIAELPEFSELENEIRKKVLIKLGDNITTDDILPAGSLIKLRSNVPKYSEYVFYGIDANFSKKARENNGGIIVGGENYGQGSSREHAALCCRFLKISVVIAKSFARIHKANLINFGIIPLEFKDKEGYEKIEQGDVIEIKNLRNVVGNSSTAMAKNLSRSSEIELILNASEREREILLSGGALNFVRKKQKLAG